MSSSLTVKTEFSIAQLDICNCKYTVYIYIYDFILTRGDSGKVVMNIAVWRGPQQQRETE